jgi:hypothetical protein
MATRQGYYDSLLTDQEKQYATSKLVNDVLNFIFDKFDKDDSLMAGYQETYNFAVKTKLIEYLPKIEGKLKAFHVAHQNIPAKELAQMEVEFLLSLLKEIEE